LGELKKQHVEAVKAVTFKHSELELARSLDEKGASRLKLKVETLRAQITEGAPTEYAKLCDQIKVYKVKIADADTEIGRLKAVIANLAAAKQSKHEAEVKLDGKHVELERIRKTRSEWSYLKDACAKDGIRQLEIDAVVPRINLYANELLRVGQFNDMVKLITQDPEGREVLDLLTIDQDGDEVLLSNRSGGEKVWPLKTIRLAMARLNNEKSGRDFRTLLADEEDSPLSVENALRFVSLYRSIITPHAETGVSTFDDAYFITHKPECASLADHLLTFKKGVVEID